MLAAVAVSIQDPPNTKNCEAISKKREKGRECFPFAGPDGRGLNSATISRLGIPLLNASDLDCLPDVRPGGLNSAAIQLIIRRKYAMKSTIRILAVVVLERLLSLDAVLDEPK